MYLRRVKTVIGALGILGLCGSSVTAATREVHGRTGLPTVRKGGENIWIERGDVSLNASGSMLKVDQQFRLRYPGPPLETGGLNATIAVREDYFRSIAAGAPKVTTAEARGFRRFSVWIDGRRVRSRALPWEMNDKQDTATRWRQWNVAFRPGQVHTMRIVSEAPLGWYDDSRWVAFVSKDLGHWRQSPDYLDIHLTSPGHVQTRLVEYQPKPTSMSSSRLDWIYRKADPDRDVFVLLPTGFAHRSMK